MTELKPHVCNIRDIFRRREKNQNMIAPNVGLFNLPPACYILHTWYPLGSLVLILFPSFPTGFFMFLLPQVFSGVLLLTQQSVDAHEGFGTAGFHPDVLSAAILVDPAR